LRRSSPPSGWWKLPPALRGLRVLLLLPRALLRALVLADEAPPPPPSALATVSVLARRRGRATGRVRSRRAEAGSGAMRGTVVTGWGSADHGS
jgi:hypothetical protein